jgi:hypothetical protein
MVRAMSSEPRIPCHHEAVPSVSMSSDAHYRPPVWGRLYMLGRLTDARIAYHQRQGRYQRRQVRHVHGGRLVYSC